MRVVIAQCSEVEVGRLRRRERGVSVAAGEEGEMRKMADFRSVEQKEERGVRATRCVGMDEDMLG